MISSRWFPLKAVAWKWRLVFYVYLRDSCCHFELVYLPGRAVAASCISKHNLCPELWLPRISQKASSFSVKSVYSFMGSSHFRVLRYSWTKLYRSHNFTLRTVRRSSLSLSRSYFVVENTVFLHKLWHFHVKILTI